MTFEKIDKPKHARKGISFIGVNKNGQIIFSSSASLLFHLQKFSAAELYYDEETSAIGVLPKKIMENGRYNFAGLQKKQQVHIEAQLFFEYLGLELPEKTKRFEPSLRDDGMIYFKYGLSGTDNE